MTFEQIQHATLTLAPADRLRLIQRLLDSLVPTVQNVPVSNEENPLTDWLGVFSGTSGDIAERADEILLSAVDPIAGFGAN